MNVEIGAEAALFPEKEYIYGIFVAVLMTSHTIVSERNTMMRNFVVLFIGYKIKYVFTFYRSADCCREYIFHWLIVEKYNILLFFWKSSSLWALISHWSIFFRLLLLIECAVEKGRAVLYCTRILSQSSEVRRCSTSLSDITSSETPVPLPQNIL
jgi:hypothetical protein